MLCLIDNYDSFTYNIVSYLNQLGIQPWIVKNDAMTLDQLASHDIEGILISPGPARHRSPALRSRPSRPTRVKSRFWGSAWVTKRSPRPSVGISSMLARSCTVRYRTYTTTDVACSPASANRCA